MVELANILMQYETFEWVLAYHPLLIDGKNWKVVSHCKKEGSN